MRFVSRVDSRFLVRLALTHTQAMKGLPSYTPLASSDASRTYSAWSRRFAALALLAVLAVGSQSWITQSTTSDSILDQVYDAVQELRWKTTVLSQDPQERALQLMTRQPVIGQQLILSRRCERDAVLRLAGVHSAC